MLWILSRAYARAYGLIKDRTGRNLKGLGFLLRRLQRDRDFNACGYRWHFDHRIAGTYMRLPGGSFNEPETHRLLNHVASQIKTPVTFIDVGTNIGEMVVVMAAHPNVARVIGFEPHPVCSDVCRRNLQLNRLSADVRTLVVGDGTAQPYVIDPKYAPTSGIKREMVDAPRSPTVRLDDQLEAGAGETIVLIDVEGSELDVMRGAASFIRHQRPLVIFEYNDDNRRVYSLMDVRQVLGEGYEILRLRLDGRLDRNLDDTWNCVAVPTSSAFKPALQGLLED